MARAGWSDGAALSAAFGTCPRGCIILPERHFENSKKGTHPAARPPPSRTLQGCTPADQPVEPAGST
eukprot:2660097-Prymnesium_polylepis.1